jgi:hypothetical protein
MPRVLNKREREVVTTPEGKMQGVRGGWGGGKHLPSSTREETMQGEADGSMPDGLEELGEDAYSAGGDGQP